MLHAVIYENSHRDPLENKQQLGFKMFYGIKENLLLF